MTKYADGAFDGRTPRITAVDANEIPKIAGGRKHWAGRDADARDLERAGIERVQAVAAAQERALARP